MYYMFNNFNKKGIKLKYQKVYQFMIAVFTVTVCHL